MFERVITVYGRGVPAEYCAPLPYKASKTTQLWWHSNNYTHTDGPSVVDKPSGETQCSTKVSLCVELQILSRLRDRVLFFLHTPSAKTCISSLSRDGDPPEVVETKHGFSIMHFCLDSFGGNFRDTTLASVWYFWFKVLKLLENWKNYDSNDQLSFLFCAHAIHGPENNGACRSLSRLRDVTLTSCLIIDHDTLS